MTENEKTILNLEEEIESLRRKIEKINKVITEKEQILASRKARAERYALQQSNRLSKSTPSDKKSEEVSN